MWTLAAAAGSGRVAGLISRERFAGRAGFIPTPWAGGRWATPFHAVGRSVQVRAGGSQGEGSSQELPRPPAAKKKKGKKRRLDEVCLEQFPQHSRNVVQSWITQGKVTVNNRVVHKAGTQVSGTADIVIRAVEPKYVCRAGLKMEAALDAFEVDPTGWLCLDSGLSTGGFTDCLLQRGASRVFGVDVGYGQVAEKIRVHPQVEVLERTNLRHLRELPGEAICRLATLDLSFISVLKVLPAVCSVLEEGGQMVVLVKPQFEAEKGQVGAGGVVRDDDVRSEILNKVIVGVEAFGFTCKGHIVSPIKGATSGNTEFLAHFVRSHGGPGINQPEKNFGPPVTGGGP